MLVRATTVIAFAIAFLGAGAHIFGLTQIMHFNEDIWQRYMFTPANIWTQATYTYWSPSYYLLRYTSTLFPAWGVASHVPLICAFGVFTWLLMSVLKHSLGLPVLPLALGLDLFLSSPSITEATYWMAGTHSLVGTFWFLIFLRVLPQDWSQRDWTALVPAAVAYVCFFGSSPLTYLPAALIFLYLFLRSFREPKKIALLLVVGTLCTLHMGWRNYLINGDPLEFQTAYNQATDPSLLGLLQKLSETIEFSNPIALVGRYWSTGYLTYSTHSLLPLLHLLWFIPLVMAVLRKGSRHFWFVLLFGLGSVGTLMCASGLAQRHFFPLVVFHVLFLACGIKLLMNQVKLFAAVVGLGALLLSGSNLWIKIQSEYPNWYVMMHAERDALDLARRQNSAAPYLVFSITEPWKLKTEPQQYTGGFWPTVDGLRIFLAYLSIPTCIYQGIEPDSGNEGLRSFLYRSNSGDFTRIVDNPLPVPDCPLSPESGPARCYRYSLRTGLFGGYEPMKGMLLVPICDFNSKTEISDLNCREVSVRCD